MTQNQAQLLRAHLCDLLSAVGPEAPTLCDGWNARDLAAHLSIRDRRPDAMPGIMIEKLAGYTKSVQDGEAQRPYEELVERVRTGPPTYSPMRLSAIDEKANTAEYAIHAQDVLLAQPADVQQTLPPLPDGTEAALWKALGVMGKMALRSCPVRVVAVDLDGNEQELCAGKNAPTPTRGVRLVGKPSDILMTLSGRGAAVPTRLEGETDAVTAFEKLQLGM